MKEKRERREREKVDESKMDLIRVCLKLSKSHHHFSGFHFSISSQLKSEVRRNLFSFFTFEIEKSIERRMIKRGRVSGERKERKSNDEMVVSSKLNRCLISIDQADKIAVQNMKRTKKSKKQREKK